MDTDNRKQRLVGWEQWVFGLLAFGFPLVVFRSGYDSFHEPKWYLLMLVTGILLVIRALRNQRVLRPWTPLDYPLAAGLLVCLLAWRWQAPDRWVTLLLWGRLVVVYLWWRLLVSHLAQTTPSEQRATIRCLLTGLLAGATGTALLTLVQDAGWLRWSAGPVSDWRFHLSASLGNPNEVGGYLAYLLPLLVVTGCLVRAGANTFDTSCFRRKTASALWGGSLIICLAALTTVFTVGAWLGLFVVVPLMLVLTPNRRGGRGAEKSTVWQRLLRYGWLGVLLFGIMRTQLTAGWTVELRLVCFVVGAAAGLAGGWWLVRKIALPSALCSTLFFCGMVLLVVWGGLFFPLGLAHHSDGLIEEALASPRWRSGFAARQFIWKTTAAMVQDHPWRGIGWGHYYYLHARYQGAVYLQRDLPHDRPTVGKVPQVHSDPLQMIAETGVLGGVVWWWLVGAVFLLGYRGLRRIRSGPERMLVWGCWCGLALIWFHSLVDFPLRQPQPVFLATILCAVLTSLACPVRSRQPKPGLARQFLWGAVGVALVVLALLSAHDQVWLKTGFEAMAQASRFPAQSPRQTALIRHGQESLQQIVLPGLSSHERWIYMARLQFMNNQPEAAEESLLKASRYRHSPELYDTWREIAMAQRDLEKTYRALQGMLLYNPCWSPFHDDAARVAELLGKTDQARQHRLIAEKFRVPEKPGP